MKKRNSSVKIRQIFSWIFIGLSVLFLVLLFALKNTLTEYTSDLKKANTDPEIVSSESHRIDSAYNYLKNHLPYALTFLEFGSKGCSSCKQMEGVMEEIKKLYPNKVNVQFKDVRLKENQSIMEYYGVVMIPTQVLLDKKGKEFFRHTGVLSVDDMIKIFNAQWQKRN